MDAVALLENVRVIVPLRPPYLAYLTRRYRTGRPNDTPQQKQQLFAKWWYELIRKAKYMNPLFVPIEAGLDREMLLQSIANDLEAPVVDEHAYKCILAQWPKVGTAGRRPERIEFEETGLIDGVVPDFLDFAVEWYGGIISSLKALQ
jgi:hypothetical protein